MGNTARREQLRLAKRRQRERDRTRGITAVELRLPEPQALMLRAATASPGFPAELERFLGEHVVDVEAWPVLRELAWNRADRYIPAEQALGIYERNWRFVDPAAMLPEETALLDRLKARYGAGLLNG